MQGQAVTRSRLIEISIPLGAGAGSEFIFPDQPELRHAIVEGVESFDNSLLTTAPSGALVIGSADAQNVVVTLTQASDEKIRNVPYQSFGRSFNAGIFRSYRDLSLSWDQCKLVMVGALGAGVNVAALILIHYHFPGDVGKGLPRK